MDYLIISDNQNYRFAKLVEAHKNHIQVTLYPDNIKKKYGIKQQLYNIETSDIEQFVSQVNQIDIDTKLLFELIEDTTTYIPISELSLLYFGDNYSQIQMTALLIALAKEQVDFDNHQDGSFKKCTDSERETKQLLINKAAIELAEIEACYNAFINAYNSSSNNLSDIILNITNSDLIRLINRPDRNSVIYKGLHKACTEYGMSSLEFCHKIGLVPKLEDFFISTFKLENFPTGFHYSTPKEVPTSYEFSHNDTIEVFSIDDNNTIEVDDAFSIQKTPNGHIIGIHIAAPALNQELIDMVSNNISTIYYPGNKITMLSNEIITQYSLDQGKTSNVVSIYFNIDNEFNILDYDSKIEQVTIKSNLRIETLEPLFNSENLEIDHGYPYESELKILHKFATKLEEKRGKPSVNNLIVDYNFSFNEDGKIIINPRVRGNPIDKLVSELMILANCTWGRMLTNAFIPAIYRVKQPSFPVKMTTIPESHTGLNVDYYTWATSPLRRSADFINQHQIISLVTGNKTHFTATSPALLEVVENFDSKYAKYLDFQTKMERYWSLRYLLQENISELIGTFLYRSRVQLEGVPIEIDTQGIINQKPKGSQIKVKVFNINLAKLSFEFKILD